MLETIEKIFDYTKNFTNADNFINDGKSFDATMMNFIALRETVLKLSEQFKNSNKHIEWHKISAFRNIIAHDYFGIDEYEVWEIIKNHLPKLKIDIKKLA